MLHDQKNSLPRIKVCVIIAYIVIFCSILPLRHAFLRDDQFILFWVLVFEHFIMIPLSIKAFVSSLPMRTLLSFCLGSLMTAALLFAVFFFTVFGMSDRGMGIIVFLVFPFAELVVAGVGVLAGLLYFFRKMSGKYQTASPNEIG